MARVTFWLAVWVIGTAWLLFLTSFFLPATNVLQAADSPAGTPLTGWEAFTTSMYCGVFNPFAWFADPRVLVFLIFPFANALVLAVPVLALVLQEKTAILGLFLVPCALVPWLLPKHLMGDLFIGFYCWNLSFFLISVGCALVSLALILEHPDRYGVFD